MGFSFKKKSGGGGGSGPKIGSNRSKTPKPTHEPQNLVGNSVIQSQITPPSEEPSLLGPAPNKPLPPTPVSSSAPTRPPPPIPVSSSAPTRPPPPIPVSSKPPSRPPPPVPLTGAPKQEVAPTPLESSAPSIEVPPAPLPMTSAPKQGVAPTPLVQGAKEKPVLGRTRGQRQLDIPTAKSQRPGIRRQKARPLDDVQSSRVMTDTDVVSSKTLGGGSYNDVRKLELAQELDGSKTGYFKADKIGREKSDQAASCTIGQTDGDNHMSTRAVLSSRLDQALGTNVLAREEFATLGGQNGSISAGVKGVALQENLYEKKSTMTDEQYATSGRKGMYQKQEDGSYNEMTKQSFADIDLKNATTQKGLADLQLMDALTGQADRHAGNIFVDKETGQVKGIDNDLSFGETSTGAARNASNLPKQIDKQTGENLLAMKENDFLALLEGQKGDHGRLSEMEKVQAINRFKMLRGYVSQLKKDGLLIEEWNDETYEAAIANGARDNYLARHAGCIKDGKDEKKPHYVLH